MPLLSFLDENPRNILNRAGNRSMSFIKDSNVIPNHRACPIM